MLTTTRSHKAFKTGWMVLVISVLILYFTTKCWVIYPEFMALYGIAFPIAFVGIINAFSYFKEAINLADIDNDIRLFLLRFMFIIKPTLIILLSGLLFVTLVEL